MFSLKEKFAVLRNFCRPMKLFHRRLYFFTLQRTRVNEYFCSMTLDITFHVIECGVTTCPGYGETVQAVTLHVKFHIRKIEK